MSAASPAIRLEGVSKRYTIGATQTNLLAEKLSLLVRHRRAKPEEFWALRDVDMEIYDGDVVGIVGRNGAGKSTLLKILTQVTAPTEGRVTVRGRLGALLEVGTGFHPELTGRENVFLNGTILGMSRAEIDARFDEIVEFSGVERFLDTPVKRYSSGMIVRLGFSVAAHVNPEILIIDEVLAVGDADFQRKCIAKIEEIAASGRTVLFVSHNLAAVQRICKRAYLLEAGRVIQEGGSGEIVASYLTKGGGDQKSGIVDLGDNVERGGNGDALLRRVELQGPDGQPSGRLMLGDEFTVAMDWEVLRPVRRGIVEVGIVTPEGTRVLTVQSTDGGQHALDLEPGTHRIEAQVAASLLPGDYRLDAGMRLFGAATNADFVWDALSFSVADANEDTGEVWVWNDTRNHVRPPSQWSISAASHV